MDDKVKELVEWVADKIFLSAQRFVCLDVCGECCNFGDDECQHENATSTWNEMTECPQDRLVADTLAKQILSHPDLALIDRRDLNLGGMPVISRDACLRLSNLLGRPVGIIAQVYAEAQLDLLKSGGFFGIPLAEALKENTDADRQDSPTDRSQKASEP